MKEVFPGVFRRGRRLFTLNLRPGRRVYGERLYRKEGKEYREWDPRRSKLAAAILLGLRENPILPGKRVLYLGAASGTTVSHVSDIVGPEGLVAAVEFSPQVFERLLALAEERDNVIPLLRDARQPETYSQLLSDFGSFHVLYQDVAQPDQADILLKNAGFLAAGGEALVAVKAQSVDVSKTPSQVFAEFEEEVLAKFSLEEKILLGKFHRHHAFYRLRVR